MTRAAISRARATLAGARSALALAACDRGPSRLDASNEVLATLPGTHRRGSVAVSGDGRGWAFVDARADGVRVVTDGVAGRAWVEARPGDRALPTAGVYGQEREGRRPSL